MTFDGRKCSRRLKCCKLHLRTRGGRCQAARAVVHWEAEQRGWMIRGEKGSKKGIGMILKFPFSMQKMCLGPGWIKRMERYFQLRVGGCSWREIWNGNCSFGRGGLNVVLVVGVFPYDSTLERFQRRCDKEIPTNLDSESFWSIARDEARRECDGV